MNMRLIFEILVTLCVLFTFAINGGEGNSPLNRRSKDCPNGIVYREGCKLCYCMEDPNGWVTTKCESKYSGKSCAAVSLGAHCDPKKLVYDYREECEGRCTCNRARNVTTCKNLPCDNAVLSLLGYYDETVDSIDSPKSESDSVPSQSEETVQRGVIKALKTRKSHSGVTENKHKEHAGRAKTAHETRGNKKKRSKGNTGPDDIGEDAKKIDVKHDKISVDNVHKDTASNKKKRSRKDTEEAEKKKDESAPVETEAGEEGKAKEDTTEVTEKEKEEGVKANKNSSHEENEQPEKEIEDKSANAHTKIFDDENDQPEGGKNEEKEHVKSQARNNILKKNDTTNNGGNSIVVNCPCTNMTRVAKVAGSLRVLPPDEHTTEAPVAASKFPSLVNQKSKRCPHGVYYRKGCRVCYCLTHKTFCESNYPDTVCLYWAVKIHCFKSRLAYNYNEKCEGDCECKICEEDPLRTVTTCERLPCHNSVLKEYGILKSTVTTTPIVNTFPENLISNYPGSDLEDNQEYN